MPLDHDAELKEHSLSTDFEMPAAKNLKVAAAVFEDQMWALAEQYFGAKAPSFAALSEAVSLIRSCGELHTAVITASYMLLNCESLSSKAEGLLADLAAMEARFLQCLKDDLAQLDLDVC